jgi:hypothetical protein
VGCVGCGRAQACRGHAPGGVQGTGTGHVPRGPRGACVGRRRVVCAASAGPPRAPPPGGGGYPCPGARDRYVMRLADPVHKSESRFFRVSKLRARARGMEYKTCAHLRV